MKNISIIFTLMFSLTSMAAEKALVSLTPNCFDDPDLRISEYPKIENGFTIYSNSAEYLANFKNVYCTVHAPEDQVECQYEETLSGFYQGQDTPMKAILLPSGYDIELSGSLYINFPSGRTCEFKIIQ